MKIDIRCLAVTHKFISEAEKLETDINVIHVTNCKCSKEDIHVQGKTHETCNDCFNAGYIDAKRTFIKDVKDFYHKLVWGQ